MNSADRTAWWSATFAVLAFHVPLLDGGVPSGFDVVNEKLYWRTWTFDRLRHGSLPLWNPHVLCGYPMHADPVQSLFYPLEWIHLVLPHGFAIGVSFVLAGVIGCWGAMRLARTLGAEAWGSGLAGVAYSTSGLVAGHISLGEVPHLQSIGWTPWCLALTVEALGGRRRSLVAVPIVTALAVLAGHVQYAYQTMVAVGIVSVTSACFVTPRREVIRRLCLHVLPAIVLGLAFTSITMVPALSYVSRSNRGGGLDWMTTTTGAIHPLELLRFIAPNFFGDAVTTPYWGGFIKEMATPYVGLPTLVAALWAFDRGARRGTRLIAPMALVGVLVGLSAYTPVHHWLFRLLPGFAFFRMPVRWLHLTTLGLAVLGGLGLTSLQQAANPGHPRQRDLVRAAAYPVLLTAMAVALFSPSGRLGPTRYARFEALLRSRVDSFLGADPALLVPRWTADGALRRTVARDATLRALALALVSGVGVLVAPRLPRLTGPLALAAVAADLFSTGIRYIDTVPPSSLQTPPELRAVLASAPEARSLSLLPSTIVPRAPAFVRSYPGFNRFSQSYIHRGMAENRRDVGGVFFVVSSRYRALAGVTSSFEHETIEDRAILDLLGVRWVLAPMGAWPIDRLPESELDRRIETRDIRLLENPHPGPRVFLARSVEVVDDLETARSRILESSSSSRRAVLIVEDLPGAGLTSAQVTSLAVDSGEATILHDGDEHMVIRVRTPRDGLLVVADTYDPGWVASVDGAKVPVLRADLALRAIPIPGGTHDVDLRYRPRPLLYGVALTVVAAVCWVVFWRRERLHWKPKLR